MKTLQEQYKAIQNGQGNKTQFLKQARYLFPEYFNQYTDFSTAVNVLKSKQIISEAAGGVVSKGFDIWDWKKLLAEEVKAEEKETSKEVKDYRKNAYDNTNMKNADNINFNEIMKGFYCELKDEKNAGKTGDELKELVVKNLAKDPLYYTKNGEFGVKGVGYTTDAPGLGEPKAPKGKHKSSGYGDLKENKSAVASDPEGMKKINKGSLTQLLKYAKEQGSDDKTIKYLEGELAKLKENTDILDYYAETIESNNMTEDEAYAYLEDIGLPHFQINSIINYVFPIEENVDEVLNEASMLFSTINSDFSKDIFVDNNKIYISPKLAQSLESSFFSRGPSSYERTRSDLDKAKTTYLKIDQGFRGILKAGLKGATVTELPKKNSEGTFKWVALNISEKKYDMSITPEKITINKRQVEETDITGTAGDLEKEKEAKKAQITTPNPKVTQEQKLRSLIRTIIKEELNLNEGSIPAKAEKITDKVIKWYENHPNPKMKELLNSVERNIEKMLSKTTGKDAISVEEFEKIVKSKYGKPFEDPNYSVFKKATNK